MVRKKKRPLPPHKFPLPKPKGLSFPKRLAFIVIYATLLLICTALLVLILEVAATPFVELPSAFYMGSSRLNHVWPPGRYQTHDEWIKDNPEFPVPYTHFYNVQGWIEDYDVARTKPANTYRIFLSWRLLHGRLCFNA